MVNKKLCIGVIGIQGAVSEHVVLMKQVFSSSSIDGSVEIIKPSDSLKDIDGVILPGGESTTISRVLQSSGLFSELQQKTSEGTIALMGTCAGCILLASKLSDNEKEIPLLNVMDTQVRRNAYGRQKESFEQDIDVSILGSIIDTKSLFPAVFIRAPIIEKVFGEQVRVLAVDASHRPVIVQQKNCIALTFHPELSNDPRIHQYFLSMVKKIEKLSRK